MAFNPFGYSNAQSKPFTETPEYEKYRYQYGQSPTGATDAISNMNHAQGAVEERKAPQMQGAQMTGTQLDQGDANQARGFQMGSLASLQSAANGEAPSAAENLARQGMDRSIRAQTSAAGSVRGGPGATASAFRFASQGAAGQRADMNQGIQAERAGEMAGARSQLAGAAAGVRGQDLGAATSNANLTQDTNKTNATLLQDTNKTNTGMDLQQTALNDQRAAQYEGLKNKVNEDQLDANVQEQGIAAGVRTKTDALNQQTNQNNANRTWDVSKGILSAGMGAVGGAMKFLSDPDTKMPVMGSLAGLGLGGRTTAHGVGGGTELDQSGGMSHDTLLEAGSGLASPQPVQGMVGGGGITGGYVPTGEDGTSGGSMMSDEKTKESPQTFGEDEDRSSPTFRSWLGRAAKGAPEDGVTPSAGAITSGAAPVKDRSELIQEIERGTAGAKPYDRDPEVAKGVAGAPRGYSNGREAPEEDKVSWSKPDTWGSNQKGKDTSDVSGQAPGQDDWQRYGAPEKTTMRKGADGESYAHSERANEGDTDWNNGGSIAKPEGRPGIFESIFNGVANSPGFGSSQAWGTEPRDTATSDERAKEDPKKAERDDDIRRRTKKVEDASVLGGILGGALSWLAPGAAPFVSATSAGAGLAAKAAAPEKRKEEQQSDLDAERAAMNAAERAKSMPAGASTASMQTPRSLDESYAALQSAGKNGPTIASKEDALMYSDERTKEGFSHVPDQDMAEAMRSMNPAVYAYKGKFTPPDQDPGEVNVGPMANKMAADPVARTAIVRDPSSGMLAIDKTKAEKVIMGSLASLQHQVDQLDNDVPRAARAKRQRRGESRTNA